MSLRDIGEIVNRAYEVFSKGKKPLEVAIKLNIGQAQTTQYYAEYLKLSGLDDIIKLYLEFKADVSYFVNLCKAAKSANITIPQVIKLLNIANNDLPVAEHRYDSFSTPLTSISALHNMVIAYYSLVVDQIVSWPIIITICIPIYIVVI
jgi:hypothetical protein